MNPERKTCKNCKKDFVIEAEDFAFYERIQVPPPTCAQIAAITAAAKNSIPPSFGTGSASVQVYVLKTNSIKISPTIHIMGKHSVTLSSRPHMRPTSRK